MHRFVVVLTVLLSAAPALAAEIKVLSAGAFKPVVVALVPETRGRPQETESGET